MGLTDAFTRWRDHEAVDPPAAELSTFALAHTDLAGLFVGDGVIDDDVVGTLLDPSPERDDALLELAAGRRAEACERLEEAADRLTAAIEMAVAARLDGIAAHARHDCARVLIKRGDAGDLGRAVGLLDMALTAASERGMDELAGQITKLGENWLS